MTIVENYGGRLLSSSKTASCAPRTVWGFLATGKNVGLRIHDVLPVLMVVFSYSPIGCYLELYVRLN